MNYSARNRSESLCDDDEKRRAEGGEGRNLKCPDPLCDRYVFLDEQEWRAGECQCWSPCCFLCCEKKEEPGG